ncbi:hypothetical protein [Mesorhizobium sp. 10J20-29]
MAVVVIENVEPRKFVKGGGEQPAVIAGEGLNLVGLEAGFVDNKGKVVPAKNSKGEPILHIVSPDVDDVSAARFPILVEPFDGLKAGKYRLFVRLPGDDVSQCNYGGSKPRDKGAVAALDTCYLYTDPIDFADF